MRLTDQLEQARQERKEARQEANTLRQQLDMSHFSEVQYSAPSSLVSYTSLRVQSTYCIPVQEFIDLCRVHLFLSTEPTLYTCSRVLIVQGLDYTTFLEESM